MKEPAVKGQTTWVRSTEIDFVLPDDEEASAPNVISSARAGTYKGSIESAPALAAESASAEPQRPAATPAIDSDEGVQNELSALAGLFA